MLIFWGGGNAAALFFARYLNPQNGFFDIFCAK